MGGEHGETVLLDAGGREVSITSPNKVFFSKGGQTKLDLARYYLAVAEPIMAAMADRPTMLQRFPDGASGKSFYQKRVPKGAPDWLETTTVSTPNGTDSNALVASDIAHLLWAVNMGCLGFHVWPTHASSPEIADELRIDLDPSPGVGFDMIQQAAHSVREMLDEVGVASYAKTSGSRGLHIYALLEQRWNSYDVRFAAVALARELERRQPDLLTAAWWKEERGERVFVDFNQNAPHKTVFGAWSVRPRVGAQVSTPLSWDEVSTVIPNELTMDDVPERLAAMGNPWAPMYDERQTIAPLLKWHERDMSNGMMDAPWPPVYPKQPNEPPRVAPSRAKSVD